MSEQSNPELLPSVFLNDRLGDTSCRCTPECRDIVSTFRAQATRYRLRAPLYVGLTVGELSVLPRDKLGQGVMAIAAIDLNDYPNADQLLEEASTVTTKRRQVNRAISRAQREGYYVKPFPFALHIPDIVDIHRSKDVRNGRAIAGDYYLADVDQLGGAPTEPMSVQPPECPQHYWQYWGVFRRAEGHHQGAVRTDEVLLGYITLRRQGDSAWYDKLMGHGDHFAAGIMNLLHYELAASLIRERPEGLRYLVYHHYTTGHDHALLQWKTRALFKPRYMQYIDDRRIRLPAHPPMPGFEGLMAIKQTIDSPAVQGRETARVLGVSAEWLQTLHYAWVVERARAPSLTSRMLREAPLPPRDVLRPLASQLFPIEAVSTGARVAVLLHGDNRGLDTLLPLADAGANNVAVFHADPAELDVLRAMYPESWSYAPLEQTPDCGDADVIVVDPPLLSAASYIQAELAPTLARLRGALILGVSARAFASLKCDTGATALFTERFGRMHDRALVCRKTLFRHGEPEEMFWLWLEPEA